MPRIKSHNRITATLEWYSSRIANQIHGINEMISTVCVQPLVQDICFLHRKEISCCVKLHCYLHFISSLIELQNIDIALILQDLSKNNSSILARLPKQRRAYQRASGGLQLSAAKFSKPSSLA